MQNQATQPRTPTEIATLFGMKNPRLARITRDIKTKLGIAFRKGDDLVTVYESGVI